MNTTLYINNIRGFHQAEIHFKDVNFLVGENSTGKTSLLSILKFLSTLQFYLNLEFNDETIEFGNFVDIVSNNAENNKFFNIGVIEHSSRKVQEEKTPFAWLMTFSEDGGLPILSRYLEVYEDKQVSLIFSKKDVRYKVSKSNMRNHPEQKTILLFKRQSKHLNYEQSEHTLLQMPDGFNWRRPLAQKSTIFENIPSLGLDYSFGLATPDFLHHFAWISPVRSKPKRTYDSYVLNYTPEGDHAPYLIREMLQGKRTKDRFLNFSERYGRESGLFDSLLVKDYTKEKAPPFELDVVLDGHPLKISNVGYGVSQFLPILVELFARTRGHWFGIQQPEVHLHPKAQAAIGDILFKLAKEENKKLFIETHSDYLIDRFRLNYQKKISKNMPASQVLFFERTRSGNKITPIHIGENGEYPTKQPVKFRDFFIREELKLLSIK